MDYTVAKATFDKSKKLRLALRRKWKEGPTALVVMLNPSAGATKDDPTLRRLTELLDAIGFGGYTVCNWSPFISADPKAMMAYMNQVYSGSPSAVRRAMKLNLMTLEREVEAADKIIAAWGNDFPASMKAGDALSVYTAKILTLLMDGYRGDLYCFGVTKHGAPKHPLARGRSRVPNGAKIVPWIGRHT